MPKRNSDAEFRAITVELNESRLVDLQFVQKLERELSNRGRHTYLFNPESSHGIKGIVKHLNDAGIVVLLYAKKDLDTSVFKSTRGYISDWITDDIKSVTDAADYIYKASAIGGATITIGDYI